MSRLPFLGRLARRYAVRHRGQTVRAVLGLLVATTVLATGLGLGESIAVSLEREALARFGPIDATWSAEGAFEASRVERVLADADVRAQGVAGVATLAVTGSVTDVDTGLAEAFATIRGVGAQERARLGVLPGGAPEPGRGEAVVSEGLAGSVGAEVGHTLRLRAPPPDLAPDLETFALVGLANAPDAAPTMARVVVRSGAIGLGAEVAWNGPATLTVEAVSPSGIAFANQSATSPVQLLVPGPLEEGEWIVRVLGDVPAVYQGGGGVAYLPLDLAGAGYATFEARVVAVVPEEGRAGITGRPTVLLPLADLEERLGARGNATHAYFRVAGDPYAAVAAIEDALGDDADRFEVRADKAELLSEAKEAGAELTGFLLVMGAFTILAAVLLAFTLFSALVEERRVELGVMRALGLTRGEVALAMTLEGALYAAVAALAGLALGLGILWGLLALIGSFSAAEGGPTFALHVGGGTLLLAFLLGALLPLVTIGFASLRFARLDPSRAIRGIPDDPRARRRTGLVVGAILVVLGALLVPDEVSRLVGVPLVFVGVAVAAMTSRKSAIALAAAALGVAHLAWTLYAFDAFPEGRDELDPIYTLGRGGLLALGLAALAVSSPWPYERAASLLGHARARRGAFLALKYVVARRRPAGLTIAMISLVVVVVTVMGTLFSLFGASIPTTEAGYDVLGESPLALDDFPRPLTPDAAAGVERADFLPRHTALRQAVVTRPDGSVVEFEAGSRQFLGVTPDFAAANEYALAARAPQYGSDRAAWDAVARGEALLFPEWAVELNGLEPGERLTFDAGPAGAREYVVAGGVDSDFVFQTFAAADHVRAMGFPLTTTVFVRAAEGADPNAVAHRLAAVYAEDGLTFTSIPEEVARVSQSIQALVLVFESFLALGLFVGLAATGFLAQRAVRERMRDIGTLRALGYEERDVRAAFLIEATLTAGMGILVGLVSGLLVAHSIWWRNIQGEVPFRPPWLLLALFTVAVVGLAAWASSGPAKRAARLPPAIAVRHVE